MDFSTISQLVASIGFPAAIAILLWQRQTKMDQNNRLDTKGQIDGLKQDLKNERDERKRQHDEYELKLEKQAEEHTKDRELFKENSRIFQENSKTFQSVVAQYGKINTDVISIKNTQENMEKDLNFIKEKLDA